MPIKINGATSGSTTITAPATGGDESIELSTALASKLDLAGGKILQIVRATDTTDRSTTSGTFVDASISVTITPQKSDSAVLLIWATTVRPQTNGLVWLIITDASNNQIGGNRIVIGGTNLTAGSFYVPVIAYATPATTSATTYKGRFAAEVASPATLFNSSWASGQMYALEISA